MSCYSGRIEAVLYNTNEYLVSFDRPGLGKHHIPDTEVRVRAGLQSCSTHTPPDELSGHWSHVGLRVVVTLLLTPCAAEYGPTTDLLHY